MHTDQKYMNVTANAFPNSVRRTKTLLACGIIVTPLFFAVVFIQSFTRAGFNLFNAPLSLLSLGTLGWIQIANFIISGILALACAFGTYRATAGYKGRTLGSLLIGTFGLGLILAGICHPDPGYGFPPGTGAPAGMLPKMSGHATLHSVGFLMVVVSLIAACFVFSRAFHYRGLRGWAIYCAATGTIAPVLIVLGIVTNTIILLTTMAVITYGWLSVVATRLKANMD